MTAQRACLVSTTMAVLVACADAPGDDRLENAAARWEASQPVHYVVQTCTLGSFPPGCVRAAVEDTEAIAIEERIFADGLGWEPFERQSSPLDDMFDRVREGDTDECKLADVDYDREFGFVEWYELTCDGTEDGRWVACFEPDMLELDACDIVPAE